MEKKHRDITVDGQKYGWIAGEETLSVYKNKKVIFTEPTDTDAIQPHEVAELIKEHNAEIIQYKLNQTLDIERAAWLSKIPYGHHKGDVFLGQQKGWLKKMAKKHDVSIDFLEEKFDIDNGTGSSLGDFIFNDEQVVMISRIINSFGSGEHAWCDETTINGFYVNYLVEIIETNEISTRLRDKGNELLDSILEIIK